ncbi:DUF4178 domain-containing protein [Neisseria sp. Ec49-e6-T10]|uniref:DUF4178 domain-containing protein n=1 Tax=Neisseria sp. Ec49-e6-T10 TaxID=3140744 RepID=UPI003EBC4632
MVNALFSLDCPCCGAKVPVYSATSVLVVCEYCHSSLIRSEDRAIDSGRKSALFEDFSPIQLYTSGTFKGQPFQIIGRLQIEYDQGSWNEWYVLFANGSRGWLGDSGGQFMFTFLAEPLPDTQLLPFSEVKAGITTVTYRNLKFRASDVREARSIKANAQGELPFLLTEDEKVLAADFRYQSDFLTLDYSENEEKPLVYIGQAVDLSNLHCQNLRSNDTILESAGKLKGSRAALECPNCGSSLSWFPGVAQNVICPSCHSDLDLTEGQAKVAKVYNMRAAQADSASIKLGERAKIGGRTWVVIGLMCVHELEEHVARSAVDGIFNSNQNIRVLPDRWYEYLLYHPQVGFQWLIESTEGWEISHQLDHWPALNIQGQPIQFKKTLKPTVCYGAKVMYAAGAFSWHVQPDDVTFITDYVYGNEKLTCERTAHEMTWSRSQKVSGQELAQWFGRPELKSLNQFSGINFDFGGFTKTHAIILSVIFILINLPVMSKLSEVFDHFEILLFVNMVVWVMLWTPFRENEDDD